MSGGRNDTGYPPAHGRGPSRHRTHDVNSEDAAACGIKSWLAVGDNRYGIPAGEERHFLRVPPERGLGAPHVRHPLSEWLAANASAGPSTGP